MKKIVRDWPEGNLEIWEGSDRLGLGLELGCGWWWERWLWSSFELELESKQGKQPI